MQDRNDDPTGSGPQAFATREVLAAVAGRMLPSVAALAAGGPVHTLACWQDAGHVASLAPLVDALGSFTSLTVAATGRPDLPVGVEHAALEPGEPLAARWSLVAVGCRGAVVLDAGPSAHPATLGRDGQPELTWTVSCDPRRAVAVARAQLRELGARIGPERSASLHAAVTALGLHAWPTGAGGDGPAPRLAAA